MRRPRGASPAAAGRLPAVTALGGGTGLATLLSGLKAFTPRLTAIVTVTDEGGSSGRLRREYHVLPPGDIRNCLVALADEETLMSRLFQYRFGPARPPWRAAAGAAAGRARGSLAGHSFGNLFIMAMAELAGGFDRGVREASKVLAIRGRVLPSTLANVTIGAELDDGRRVEGELRIGALRSPGGAGSARIRRVYLRPARCAAAPDVAGAIETADLVVLGPGSLYTSILPNLLVPGVAAALRRTRALRLFVVNVMTQPGETDAYTAGDHLDAVIRQVGTGLVDGVVVNSQPVPAPLASRYRREGSAPVSIDPDLKDRGVRVWAASLLGRAAHRSLREPRPRFARHDSTRLARFLLTALRRGARSRTS